MAVVRVRVAAIALAYFVVFWVLLPAALWSAARALDARLGWSMAPSPVAGASVAALGLGLMAWAMVELWRRGGGLPVSALPPPRFTRRGPYRHARHPIYLGFSVTLLGAGAGLGSPALSLLLTPAVMLLSFAYARVEERGLERRFGRSYRRYRRQVGLLPRLGFYRTGQLLVGLGAVRVRAEGRDHVPEEGACVIASNHACYLDPAYVSTITARPIHFLATAEAYRGRALGFLVRHFGTVPVRRYRPDPAASREVLDLLEDGEVVGIFVEGERSALGDYRGARPEVGRLLAQLPVPVVPVGLSGSYDCGPRWAGVLRRGRVRVRAGPPVEWSGAEPAAAIDVALRRLIEPDPQPVHLAGLPPQRLSRVLWRCPRCLDEAAWRARDLTCGSCCAAYRPTDAGWFADAEGRIWSLASLGRALLAAPEAPELCASASVWRERNVFGPIEPLELVAAEAPLRLCREGLRAGALELPLSDIRSISTERADTLQVATRDAMWQFRLREGSVFRLRAALEAWQASARR